MAHFNNAHSAVVYADMAESDMAGFQFNPALALYIPVVQKWQATHGYFENAFRSSYVGVVIRVDFVARHGGDPETSDELSAYVYLNWYHNDLALNWQKVIYAKDPKMPAHFYHTVGRNYRILCQNMKPRTMEQVAEEKVVALAKQGITIIDANGTNASLLEELNMNLSAIDCLEHENSILNERIIVCEEELKQMEINNRRVEINNRQVDITNRNKILDLNQELGVLEAKRIREICVRNEQYDNLEAAYAKIAKLEKTIESFTINKVRLNEDHKETNVNFKCNACSANVSFTSGKETFADKKHLCHTCFVKTGAWLQ
jgi:hypothetical protein